MTDCPACSNFKTGDFDLPLLFETENIAGYIVTNHAASKGHCLILPKTHFEQMHEIPDETLKEIIVSLKKLAKILKVSNYNILQNNGALSFQTLFHAHFHLIPKYSEDDGLRYLRDESAFVSVDQEDIVERIKSEWN